ncbi:MAG: hypothetical protein JSR46_07245, partial [Verrucomicrobia bacterium]|nr:hypothetical protein [Verrucomicrobiota bacterium]
MEPEFPKIIISPFVDDQKEIDELTKGVENLALKESAGSKLTEKSAPLSRRKSRSFSLSAQRGTPEEILVPVKKTESVQKKRMKKSSSDSIHNSSPTLQRRTKTVSPKMKGDYNCSPTLNILPEVEITEKKVRVEKRGRALTTSLDASFCTHLRKFDIVNKDYSILSDAQIADLGSQGAHGNRNYHFCHASTSPAMDYAHNYDKRFAAKSLNMDRVGYRTNDDGSNQFFLCDGTGGGGILSAVLAQLVVSTGLEELSRKRALCSEERRGEIELLLQECAKATGNIKIFSELDESCCGSTTVCFADCIPTGIVDNKKTYQLNVASLGDCGVFHFDHKMQELTQQNTIKRKKNTFGVEDLSDCGGQILANGKIDRLTDMSLSQKEGVTEDDFIIGVTDGVLDNVHQKDTAAVLSFVITNPFFDRPFN